MVVLSKYPKVTNDLPAGEFFAILRPRSTYVPGDERSQTNPGHGYPASTEQSWDIEVFSNQAEWEREINKLSTSAYKADFKAVKIIPANIKTEVKVSI
jgi:hypothetical protein